MTSSTRERDEDGGTVDALKQRLRDAYAGRPQDIAADRAFAAVVARHAIPQALPEALLEGFAWDAAGRRYATIEDLYGYAARVAGAVGAMMALLMGARAPAALARACDLGVAMQLSNIARDVGEDARAGRLYLPLDWLREEGIDPDRFLAEPVFDAALGRVVARLLEAAAVLYRRALGGLAALPMDCRPGIAAAALLYGGIGAAVARRGYDSVGARARVGAGRKTLLLGRALASALWVPPPVTAPPLPATRFLVDVSARPEPRGVVRGLQGRVVWVIELFARLRDEQAV